MISRIYFSKSKALFLAVEDILKQFYDDYFVNDFDFVIFAIHPSYPYDDISFTIKSLLKSDNFIAFNAVSAFANQQIVEGVSALFIKFEKKGNIEIYSQDNLEKENLENYLNSNPNDLHILISAYNEMFPSFIESINTKATLVGGVASGDLERGVTYVYTPDKVIKNGFIVTTFKNVEFATGVALGYKLVGPKYRINLSKNNKIYVIDFEDASLIADSLLKNMKNPTIQDLWYSPIVILGKEKEVIRTFKDIKHGEYVELFGPVPQKIDVKLSFGIDSMLLEEDKKVANVVKQKLTNIETAFNFSCIAREFILGDLKAKESEWYVNILNSSLFGFFTFGEVASSDKIDFHNQTSVLVGIKEKDG